MSRRVGFFTEKEIFWMGKVEEQVRSGLTISAFCRREGISANSFFRWRRVLSERGQAGASMPCSAPKGLFAPVSVVSPDDVAPIELSLSSGHMLRVRPGFDSDTLVRLLALLDSSQC